MATATTTTTSNPAAGNSPARPSANNAANNDLPTLKKKVITYPTTTAAAGGGTTTSYVIDKPLPETPTDVMSWFPARVTLCISIYSCSDNWTGHSVIHSACQQLGVTYVCVHSEAARHLAMCRDALYHALVKDNCGIRQDTITAHKAFSEAARVFLGADVPNSGRCLICSDEPFPLDVVRDLDKQGNLFGTLWGEQCIFSHLLCSTTVDLQAFVGKCLEQLKPFPKQNYLLMLPTRCDLSTLQPSRCEQDVVRASFSLEDLVSVELWLQCRVERAIQGFSRTDVSVLHVQSEGVGDAIVLGSGEANVRIDEIHACQTPVVTISAGGIRSAGSFGAGVFRAGASCVMGPCVKPTKLGITGNNYEEENWYSSLYSNLLKYPIDVGVALLYARKAVKHSGSLFPYLWLIIGSSVVSFQK